VIPGFSLHDEPALMLHAPSVWQPLSEPSKRGRPPTCWFLTRTPRRHRQYAPHPRSRNEWNLVQPVRKDMTSEQVPRSRWTRVWIPLGAGLVLAALAGSAIAVPKLLVLHAFQALIYVAIIVLARRNRAVGFGAGVTIAVAWNSNEWLGPHLIQAGAREFWSFVSTGHVHRADTLMVFFAAIAHIVLLIGCLAAFRDLHPGKKEWLRFLSGGVLVLAYFAVIVAAFLPR
jgi:hypothetical protein